MVRAGDRLVLAPDDPSGAPGAVTQAGVDPTLEGRALQVQVQDALRRAIATRRGDCSWDVDHCIEAGREDGAWRLRVLPWTGDYDEEMTGPPVLDLRDQRDGEDPLALLRALLSGGSA